MVFITSFYTFLLYLASVLPLASFPPTTEIFSPHVPLNLDNIPLLDQEVSAAVLSHPNL